MVLLSQLALALFAVALAGPLELRRESSLEFAVDEAFQQDGGVQFFYELAAPTKAPAAGSTLARFRAMDPWSTNDDPYQLVASRLVYTVERDITFFTEARARDVNWLTQVAPEMGVTLERDGTFRVARAPTNRFKLTWFDAPTTVGTNQLTHDQSRHLASSILHSCASSPRAPLQTSAN